MVNELQSVVQHLGGEKALGRKFKTGADFEKAIRLGFPGSVVIEVADSAGLTLEELAAILNLSTRSLQRRRREGRLAQYESDQLYRLARLVAFAKICIGDDQAAKRWLRRPNRALGGRLPIELVGTEPGARSVENVLGRIAYGGVS